MSFTFCNFNELFVYDTSHKLRYSSNRIPKSYSTIRIGLFYDQLDKNSELMSNVVKGAFILDVLSFSNFSRAVVKTISTGYKNIDIWLSVESKINDQSFIFFTDIISDSKNISEFGYELQLGERFAHFGIFNMNPMLKLLPPSKYMEFVSSYDNDEVISFRMAYNSFSVRSFEAKPLLSTLKFLS